MNETPPLRGGLYYALRYFETPSQNKLVASARCGRARETLFGQPVSVGGGRTMKHKAYCHVGWVSPSGRNPPDTAARGLRAPRGRGSVAEGLLQRIHAHGAPGILPPRRTGMCKCRGRQDAGSDRHYYFPVGHSIRPSLDSTGCRERPAAPLTHPTPIFEIASKCFQG